MSFQFLSAFIFCFGCTTKGALSIFPAVLYAFVRDITTWIFKVGNRIFAVGIFRAIDAAAGKQAGQLRDSNAIELLAEDMIHPLLQIGNFIFQPHQQPLSNFPQKYAGFAGRVKECGVRTAEQLLRQQVQHPICHLRRSEYLVVGQVGKAGQHIGVIKILINVSHFPAPSCNPPVGIHGEGEGSAHL